MSGFDPVNGAPPPDGSAMKVGAVQSNAADPLRDQMGILARYHTAAVITTAGEQELAGPFVSGL